MAQIQSSPAETAPGSDASFGGALARLRAGIAQLVASRELVLPLAFATVLGAFVRLAFVLSVDFPLNDGGLFYTMIGDLQDAGYQLPRFSTYNGIDMPFAYPPLAFYMAAAINDVTGISTLTLLRALPVAASILSIPAFWLIARNVLPSRTELTFAVIAFALIPRAFDWEIVGGGLTRSFGFLFALLTIHQSFRLVHGSRRAWLPMAALGAVTVLFHPEMALFAAISHAVIVVCEGSSSRLLRPSLQAAALAALVTSPWWGWVVATHGIDVFVSAGSATPLPLVGILRTFVDPTVLNEPLFPMHLVLGLVGAAYCVGKRQWLLPAWVAALLVLDPRKAPTEMTVPIAMLEGIAIIGVLRPLLSPDERGLGTVGIRSLANLLVVAWVVTAAVSPVALGSPLRAISPEAREGLAAVAELTPPSSRFILVTGEAWARDPVSEWFPVLTGRESVTTPQGYEWHGSGIFKERIDAHANLQDCVSIDITCVDEWQQSINISFTHVLFVSDESLLFADDSECCQGLIASIDADDRYELIYHDSSVTLYERVSN